MPRTLRLKTLDEIAKSKIVVLRRKLGLAEIHPADLESHMFQAVVKSSWTEGKKFDDGKIRVELLPIRPQLAEAEVLTFGAKKYDDRNWEKGILWSRCYGAALRHLFAWWGGQDNDPETGLSHLAHARCCISFLLEYLETHRELDNRPHSSRSASSGTVATEVPTNGRGPVGHS